MSEIDPRSFGQLEAAVEALDARMQRVDSKLGDLDGKLQKLSDAITEARGGWRMALLLGGAAAAAGSGLTWLLQHVTLR